MAPKFNVFRRQVAAAGRRFGLSRLRCSAIVSVTSFFMLWWATTAIGLVSPEFLPSPFAIFPAAAELLTSGELQSDLLMSLIRIGGGFALAVFIGVLLGLFVGSNDIVADIFEPMVDLIRQIPPVAWIPLAIIWFGFGEGARIFIVFMGAFPPVMINTRDGVRGVDPQILRAAASLGANRSAIFWKISLPAALPSIFTGVTIGLGNAFINIVAAELAGATTGLGYMMLAARESFRTDIVILGMVLLMVLGISLMGVMLAIRRNLLSWAIQRDDA